MAYSKKRNKERLEYDPYDPSKQHKAKTSSEVFDSYLNKKVSSGLSLTSKAYAKWCEIAGKSAISHTMAVWVNDKNPKQDPGLVVYIDASTLLADFTTNAELYKDRLINAGFPVSSVTFKLSNKINGKRKVIAEKVAKKKDILPSLSNEELKEVEKLCKNLPDGVRDSAFRAMELSLKREKLENTRDGKPTS